MDIRLYSGTLTSYYTGEFEPEEILEEDNLKDTVEIYEQVLVWQSALLEELSPICKCNKWDETNKYVHCDYTDEMDLAALKLFIAYHEDKKPVPAKIKSTWKEDKVYRKMKKTKYPSIIKGEVFLPSDFDFQFTFANADNEISTFGSIYTLEKECEKLIDLLNIDKEKTKDYLEYTGDNLTDKAKIACIQIYQCVLFAKEHDTCIWIDC